MNSTIPFLWVPIAAASLYMFLLIAFVSAKKSKLLNSFIMILICFLMWTGGSMLMRLLIAPGYRFWYEVSLLALFAAPFLVFNFMFNFVESRDRFMWWTLFSGTALMLVFTHFEFFLDVPTLIERDGKTVFEYTMTWRIAIPTLFIVFVLFCGVMTVINGIKRNDITVSSLKPIIWGLPLLVIGNLASIVANNFFPWDTLSGIAFSLCMFYSLYKKHLFKMTLLVSRGIVLVEAMVLGSILAANLIEPMEKLVDKHLPFFSEDRTLVVSIAFSAIILFAYLVLKRVTNNLFLRDEQIQSQQLKDFSVAISRSLDLSEITELLCSVITAGIGTKKIFICLETTDKTGYTSSCAATPLDMRKFTITADNPCICWLRNHNKTLLLNEFKRSSVYKSMWDAEKKLISELSIGAFVPLYNDDSLMGVVLIGPKAKGSDYTYDNISFLESICSMASVALKNANLYEKALKDACTDYLTGILNRRYFMEKLNEKCDECIAAGTPISLIFLNLDDFKLFNQLYGSREGDLALVRLAQIISSTVGISGICGRYGGKEFAVCLPNADSYKANSVAEQIRSQVSASDPGEGASKLKALTFSCGICTVPYSASDINELVQYADMAVYNAKRTGKDKTVVYSRQATSISDIKDGDKKLVIGNYKDYAATIYALTAAIDAKDHYTFNHSQNVAYYATALARAINLDPEHIQMIYEAALLHDIGKIAIPENILSKPGALDHEEYEVMKTHVEHSISIIKHLPSLDYVIPAAIAHHERWDGNGYPRKLKGTEIPIGARCLAIADAFDAMTSVRSYKNAYTVEYASQQICAGAGRQFDPELAMVFVKLLDDGTVAIPKSRQIVSA